MFPTDARAPRSKLRAHIAITPLVDRESRTMHLSLGNSETGKRLLVLIADCQET
jgi:hypothetical protein